jgi:hypothetical protein
MGHGHVHHVVLAPSVVVHPSVRLQVDQEGLSLSYIFLASHVSVLTFFFGGVKTKFVRASEIDLVSGARDIEEEEVRKNPVYHQHHHHHAEGLYRRTLQRILSTGPGALLLKKRTSLLFPVSGSCVSNDVHSSSAGSPVIGFVCLLYFFLLFI